MFTNLRPAKPASSTAERSRTVRHVVAPRHQPYEAGHAYYGSAYFPADQTERVLGSAPRHRSVNWTGEMGIPTSVAVLVGVLSTAGGLLFTGDAEGISFALDAASGKPICILQTRRSGVRLLDNGLRH